MKKIFQSRCKRRGIATVVGLVFFAIFVVALMGALTAAMDFNFKTMSTEAIIGNQQSLIRHEDFSITSCVDTNNNRLFVEVENTGSQSIEFDHIWLINSSQTNEPTQLFEVVITDSYVPYGSRYNLLSNYDAQYLDPGTYKIKIVTTLGTIKISDNLEITELSRLQEFIGEFVDAESSGLDGPEGILFGPDNNLYVASENTHQVLRFDGATGDFIDVFADGTTDCNKPLGITFGPDLIGDTAGELFVASEDASQDVICMFDGSTGIFDSYFITDGLGGLRNPADVEFGPDGNLYVTSEGKNAAYRYDGTTGAFIDKFASLVSDPKFLVYGPDGNLYITSETNDKVIQFDGVTGAKITDFVTPSDQKPEQPEGIVFGPDGNLYIASEGDDEILQYDGTTGLFLKVFIAGGEGGLDEPADLVFGGPNGDLFVSSEASNSILRFGGFGSVDFIESSSSFQCSDPSSSSLSDPSDIPDTIPDAPTDLLAVPDTEQVSFSWNAPEDDGGAAITDYIVEFKESSSGIWLIFPDGTSTDTSAIINGLTDGTSYDFRVSAVNSIGTGANSSTASATPASPPGVPTLLSATPGVEEMYMTWTAPADDGGAAISDYIVEYKETSSGIWLTFADGESTDTTATVTGLIAGTSYDFRVSAENSAGVGDPSATDTATPNASATVPDAPTSLLAVPGSEQVSLDWDAPADNGGAAITDYIVEYKETSSGIWLTFADGESTDTTATVTGLTDGTSYDFRVSAVNSEGTGNPSSIVSATPTTDPTADFKIQRGTFLIGSGSTTSTITEGADFEVCSGDCFITITNTRHWGMGQTSGGGNQNADDFTVWISDDSGLTSAGGTVTFSRVGSSGDNRISWQIIEYIKVGGVNEMSVRGADVCSMSSSTTCTGNSVFVADSSDISIIITGIGNHNTGRSNLDRCQVTADLDVSNQPVFTRIGATSIDCEISYAIVEWTGSNWIVDRVTHTGSSSTSATETITDIGSMTRGFIFDTQIRLGDSSGTDGMCEQGEQVYLSSTDELTFAKPNFAVGGWGTSMEEVVYVISNIETTAGETMIVQREQPIDQQNSNGSEEETWSRSITALTYDESEAAVFGLSTHSDGCGTFFPRGSINAVFDPIGSEVDFWQSDSGEEQDYTYELVEFPRS